MRLARVEEISRTPCPSAGGLLRIRTLAVITSFTLTLGCSSLDMHRRGLVAVCECYNPWNDKEVLVEWQKVEKRLADNGISISLAQCSLTCGFCVQEEQAPEARKLIAAMITKGEVDAAKIQLRVREK